MSLGTAQTPRLCDPLEFLGHDIFHLVTAELNIPTLLVCEQVSKSWKTVLRGDAALWRQLCLNEGIEDADIIHHDALRANPHPWRRLCLEQLPSTRGWREGLPNNIEYIDFRHWNPNDPSLTKFVPLPGLNVSIFVNAADQAIVLDSQLRLFTHLGASYKAIAGCGDYFVGANWDGGSHYDGVPASLLRIDIWEIVPGDAGHRWQKNIPLPGGALKLVNQLHMPLWGFAITLHQALGSTVPTLALLAAKPRIAKSDPANPHWVASRQKLVYIYDLDTGVKEAIPLAPGNGYSKTLAMNGTHVLVPDYSKLHIYSRSSKSLVASIPLTPIGAALAAPLIMRDFAPKAWRTNRFSLPFASSTPRNQDEKAVWEAAHALAYPDHSPYTNAQVEFSASGDIVYSADGALVILRDTPTLLTTLETSTQPALDASAHSLLIASTRLFHNLQVVNDRVLVQSRSHLLMLDIGTLPIPVHQEVPPIVDPHSLLAPTFIPPQPQIFDTNKRDWIRDGLLTDATRLPGCDGPILCARLATVRGLEGIVMTPKAIYLPTSRRNELVRSGGFLTVLARPGPVVVWRFGSVRC